MSRRKRGSVQFLVIETATDTCSIAFVKNNQIISESSIYQSRRHAELLAPMIQQQSDNLQISPGELDGVVVSIGPGSFTGLRIGLSTAKGMIFNSKRKLYTVPTLLASAWSFKHVSRHLGVLHHSHRDYYFYAEYQLEENKFHITTEPIRMTFSEIQQNISPDIDLICRVPEGDENVQKLPNRVLSRDPIRASLAAKLVLDFPERWIIDEPFTAEPDYLRDYQAVKYQNPVNN